MSAESAIPSLEDNSMILSRIFPELSESRLSPNFEKESNVKSLLKLSMPSRHEDNPNSKISKNEKTILDKMI